MYALIVEGKEALSANGNIFTTEGEKFWVCNEPDGWVEATGINVNRGDTKIPGDVKTFKTRVAAEKFAKRWEGHPWWVNPNGNFEVIEIKPRYKQVRDGYERV